MYTIHHTLHDTLVDPSKGFTVCTAKRAVKKFASYEEAVAYIASRKRPRSYFLRYYGVKQA